MTRPDSDTSAQGRRQWRQGERAKTSIMQVFRASFVEHDARRVRERNDDGSIDLTSSRRQRREGISQDQLREHLEADLTALLNTIRLDAAIDLEEAPFVARSILNYGFRDLSSVGAAELNTPAIIESIRQSLIDHEPRFVRDSIEVTVREGKDMSSQRLSIVVSAELMGDPVDIPMDFDAEVDLGAGKLLMSKLRVQM